MRLRTKLIITVIVIITVVGLAYGALLIAFVASGPFRMIPQDCLLLERSLSIRVTDAITQNPIADVELSIHNVGGGGFEAGNVQFVGKTDQNGQFEKQPISVFACDTLFVEVSVEGYRPEKVSFYGDERYNISPLIQQSIKLDRDQR